METIAYRMSWVVWRPIGISISHQEFPTLGFDLVLLDEALWLVRDWSPRMGKLSFWDGLDRTVVAWPRQRVGFETTFGIFDVGHGSSHGSTCQTEVVLIVGYALSGNWEKRFFDGMVDRFIGVGR